MTVVIAVKVYDGIVVAADSATTLQLSNGSHQVWNSANKLFHLHRKHPIMAATWGLGQISSASIGTLAKDLRRRFMGHDPAHPDWELNDTYTIDEVTSRLVELMYDELYKKHVKPIAGYDLSLGFLIAGYSQGQQKSEMRRVTIVDASTPPIVDALAGPDDTGWIAFAINQPANRLLKGYDPALEALITPLVDPGKLPDLKQALESVQVNVTPPSMPFGDAIEFAAFLANTTIGYMKFALGPNLVGPPIEIAGVSRHEGFRWIQRKHYYAANLNPEDPGHDY